MKLYYSPGACSLAVRIIINELQIPCEFESVNLKTKVTQTNRDFKEINPKGAVPVLEIKPNEFLTEVAVILQYLADSNNAENLLAPTSNFKRYRVMEWLNYTATEMHKGVGILFNADIPKEVKEKTFVPLIQKKLAFLNNHFKNNSYLLGSDFTLPDAYLFVTLRWVHYFKVETSDISDLARYFKQLEQRPSIQSSLQQESLVVA